MYVIRSLISLGYWSSNRGKFGGILFADDFNSRGEAKAEIQLYINEKCEIVEVY